jgi:putative DNA primase/helicase
MTINPTKTYPKSDPEQLENIPESLKALTQWVCWRAVKNPKRSKPDKPPIDIHTGGGARSNDPKTWATWDEALAYLSEYDEVKGVGFETNATDPYTFIDLDDCRDPATGKVGDWAETALKTFDSYSEVSPSGTGIRIVIEAKLDSNHANRRAKIEVYSHSQYLTMTGILVNGTKQIAKRQSELEEFYATVFGRAPQDEPLPPLPSTDKDPKLAKVREIPDDDLVARAAAAANGAKFVKLWGGEVTDYHGDHSAADAALASILTYWTRADVERIDRLFRRSKLFRAKWDGKRGAWTYGQRTISFAIRGATSFYDPALDLQIRVGHNDIANTEIFTQLHGENYLYVLENRHWLRWNCQRWEPFADVKLLYEAEDVSKELLRVSEANPDPDPKVQEKRVKWAVSTGDRKRTEAIEKSARGRAPIHVDELNVHPYLLCCANGMLDLRTGKLRDASRADRSTRIIEYAYDKRATCPLFDRFLFEIFIGDEELIRYLWRVLGYSLTGDISERSFWIFHGEGRNGKSTLVETLKALLGSAMNGYAQKARFSTFLQKTLYGSGANDDVAHLAGARVVIANEADEKQPLNSTLIKELTGGDTARARHLFGREFEFVPQFKLFLVANTIPPIRETTYAVWDRLHYVEFNFRVADDKVDRELPLKLLGELPGILAKAVDACLEWQANGLKPPESVVKSGKKLYKANDTFGQFIDDECHVEKGKHPQSEYGKNDEPGQWWKSTGPELYRSYWWWTKKQGFSKPASASKLTRYLGSKAKDPTSPIVDLERQTDNIQWWGGFKPRREAPEIPTGDGNE